MVIQDFIFKEHLGEGEKILAVAHKHVWVILPSILRCLFFGVMIPLSIFLLFPQTSMYMFVWIWGGLLALSYVLYDWYLDAWLMTTHGFLCVEWKSFFNQTSTRVEYHMIEGVAFEIKGFWPTVLNFGVVTLEKVGSGTLVQLEDINDPKGVEQQLLECQKKFLTQKSVREHGALKDLLTEMIIDHVREHGLPDAIREKLDGK